MWESPGVSRGGWSGLELSDTLGDDLAHQCSNFSKSGGPIGGTGAHQYVT